MCLISLSRVLDLARSWCTASFVNIVGSYGVSSLSIFVVMNRIFSLWGFVIVGLNIQIWEHLMYVLHMNTRGDNGVLYWFTWCMFWHSTRGFPRWHWGNLCIGVDARFHYLFSDRNFGVSLKFFVWIEYYDYEVVWCISYNQLTDTCGDIGVSRWH